MKKKTLTETIEKEIDLSEHSATEFYVFGSGSSSGFGGGYKGGVSSMSGSPAFELNAPKLSGSYSRPSMDSPEPSNLSFITKALEQQNEFKCNSSFGSAYKPKSDFGSAYKLDVEKLTEQFRASRISSTFGSGSKSEENLYLTASEKSIKIFSEEKRGAPLIRFDFSANHGLPAKHLQYGEKDYCGRSGDEAADILATIFVKNTKIKFPWEK